MAEQFLIWPGYPTNQNNDSGLLLTLGTRFTISQNAPATGVQIRIPAVLPSGPSPAAVGIWNILDETTPLASAQFEWSSFVGQENTFQIIPLAAPLNLVTGQTYVASVQTFERWAGTPAYPFPLSTGIITATSPNGWVRVGAGYPNVLNGDGNAFGVGPVMEVATESGDAAITARAPMATIEIAATGVAPALPVDLTKMNFGSIVTGIAACVCEGLEAAGLAVCNCIGASIGPPAWDACDCSCQNGSGQLAAYVAPGGIFLSRTFPNVAQWDQSDRKCGPPYVVANINIEIARCVPTISATGKAPSAAAITASALAWNADATAVRQLVGCCLSDMLSSRQIVRFALGATSVLPESGGCAGSSLAVQVALPNCICSN